MNLAIEDYLSVLHDQDASPEKILAWTWKTFAPRVLASSSFQTQSVPLLHMISRVCPEMTEPVFDTDDARAGRWTGTGKKECGLHLE